MLIKLAGIFSTLITVNAYCEEIVIRSINLPGASMQQEVMYSTDMRDYESVRDEILSRLKKGDLSARINPSDGPWMRVETTAAIGLEYKGIGSSSGRKEIRQISAAEEALYLFERQKSN